MAGVVTGGDGVVRCGWCAGVAEFDSYHDREWGFPVDDDRRLFEKLCLEGFQSGLSWRTILNKRDNFRRAFNDFDFHAVAKFDTDDVDRLVQDAGIIRHRGKITATINNAARAVEMVATEGSLARYLWRFEPEQTTLPDPQTQTTSAASIALSRDLKKRGWRFVGPTTMFAFMQAMGLINDHAIGCDARAKAEAARANFVRP